MDIFLLISTIVMAFVILVVLAMLIVQFGSEDDKNMAYFPKLVTLSGLFLACASVLVLPLDVANAKDAGGGLQIDILWQIIFMLTALYVVLLVPFAFFFYESDVDPEEKTTGCSSQGCEAVKLTIGFFLIFAMILVLMFVFLSTAEIPISTIVQNNNLIQPIQGASIAYQPCCAADDTACTTGRVCSSDTLDITVTFPVFVLALLSFLGWFFFANFSAIGLMALPLDLINEWRTRPVQLKIKDYNAMKLQIGRRAKMLREIGEQIQSDGIEASGRKQSRKDRKQARTVFNRFEQAVYMLKKDFRYLEISQKLKGGNPIWYWAKLFMGCIGIVLSLSWVIHISVFILPNPPADPMLNTLFIELDNAFPLLGTFAFALWSLWLLWCTLKGCFKLGVRIPFILKIYPMELHNTMMNAFLANTWILLLCSVPCVQFCAEAFSVYARSTQIDLIFGSQIKYLQFFKYFFENDVFIIYLLSITGLTLILLWFKPRDKSKDIEKRLQDVAKGKGDLGLDRI